jgi:hypothetical protein
MKVEKVFKILGFVGSLHKDSYNKALMRAALELIPEGVELEIFDLEGIPPFKIEDEQKHFRPTIIIPIPISPILWRNHSTSETL